MNKPWTASEPKEIEGEARYRFAALGSWERKSLGGFSLATAKHGRVKDIVTFGGISVKDRLERMTAMKTCPKCGAPLRLSPRGLLMIMPSGGRRPAWPSQHNRKKL